MARNEFKKQTMRDALRRSQQVCEAVGVMYGLPANTRCSVSLSGGVQYDHIILDANSKDNSLDNCAAVCVKCHKWKTAHHDIPMAAKTVRMQDKANGIRKTSSSPKPSKPPTLTKQKLAPKQLFQERT